MKTFSANSFSALCFSFIVAVITLFSAATPPIQSPDETAHFARAHMLSRGVFKLTSINGQSSGGQVDTAVPAYMSHFGYLQEDTNRISATTLNKAKEVTWTGNSIFMIVPGTGYYFPALYSPYVLGLWVGEVNKLTVHNSYLLARFICTLCIALCIVVSARLFPFNPLLIYLLSLPTSLFQYASINLDGIVAAVSLLACALFARIVILKDERNLIKNTFFILLALLASCKLHLLPLYLMAWFVCTQTRKREDYYKFSISLVLVLIWTVSALLSNVDTRIELGATSLKIAEYYFVQPNKFFVVLTNTFKLPDLAISYVYYLISITPLRNGTYHLLAAGLLVLGACTLSVKSIRLNSKVHAIFTLSAFASVLSIFFLLLVTWTPHPAPIIWGVQGRYFWVPAILFSYALSGSVAWKKEMFGKLIGAIVAVFVLISLYAEMQALIARYYMVN
jgi:uncharacterized membrane protein